MQDMASSSPPVTAKHGQTTKAKLSKWGCKYKTQLLGGSGEGMSNCMEGDNKQLRSSVKEEKEGRSS